MADMSFFRKNFVLYRGTKRVNIREEELNARRISSIFKVSYDSMFLQDDRRGTYFPQDDGTFDTVEMVDRVSYEVCGDSTDENSHSTTPQMPQTQSAYSSTNSVDSIRQRTVFGPRILSGTGGSRSNNSPLPSRSRQYNQSATYSSSQSAASPVEEREISRCVYLGEFDSNSVPNIIGSIYLKLKESQCSVWKVCEALRGSGQCHFENLTLVDAKGFEIQESDETSGLRFWQTGSRKVFAVDSNEYLRAERERQERSKCKKRKRYSGSDSVVSSIEEMQDTLTNNLEELQGNILEGTRNATTNALKDIKVEIEEHHKCSKNKVIVEELSQILKCKICTNVPEDHFVLLPCCKQPIGCYHCVIQCFNTESPERDANKCPLCNTDSTEDVIKVHSFGEVLGKLQ